MAAAHHIASIVLLAGCTLLCDPTLRAWTMRPEQRSVVVSGGLLATGCASMLAMHAPAGW
jgi:hypothetical protein